MLLCMENANSAEIAVTPSELASLLRMNRRRVYAAIECGALRALRIGNGYRILPQDRNEWLESLRVK
jgi:excisionase family DNA binding protein